MIRSTRFAAFVLSLAAGSLVACGGDAAGENVSPSTPHTGDDTGGVETDSLADSGSADSQAASEAAADAAETGPAPGLYAFAGSLDGAGLVDAKSDLARFAQPNAVAIDDAGNTFVADGENGALRKIDTSGVVTTIARGLGRPAGVAVAKDGTVYVANRDQHVIHKVVGTTATVFAGKLDTPGTVDGDAATARLNAPAGLAIDAAGNVYVADTLNYAIRKIDATGKVTTYAGKLGTSGKVDGDLATARFDQPWSIAFDPGGTMYVADARNHAVRAVSTAQVTTTIAGKIGVPGDADGTGAGAQFQFPYGIARDPMSNTLVVTSTYSGTIKRVTTAGVVTTVAGTKTQYGSEDGNGAAARFRLAYGVAVRADGVILVADTDNHTIRSIDAAKNVTTIAGKAAVRATVDGVGLAARFSFASKIAVDPAGNVWVAEWPSCTLRTIAPDGTTKTVLGKVGECKTVDGAKDVVRFHRPQGIAIDPSGVVFVSDTADNVIRRIALDGSVTTFAGTVGAGDHADGIGDAARFDYPEGLALDSAGNLYVADSSNDVIRKITPAREVSTIAGKPHTTGSVDGTGDAARFQYPAQLAFGNGFLYVTDEGCNALRKMSLDGKVETVAGDCDKWGYADGVGKNARFAGLEGGIVVDEKGSVWVTDTYSHALRRVDPDGNVVTVLGAPSRPGNVFGSTASAGLYRPYGLARANDGALVIGGVAGFMRFVR